MKVMFQSAGKRTVPKLALVQVTGCAPLMRALQAVPDSAGLQAGFSSSAVLQEARRAGGQGSASAGQMERGMASFVRQTISMYRGGFDSRRMLLTVRPVPCSSASLGSREAFIISVALHGSPWVQLCQGVSSQCVIL